MLKCIDAYTSLCYTVLKKILEISDKNTLIFVSTRLLIKNTYFLILT